MYSKKDFDKEYKNNTKNIKHTKPVLKVFGAFGLFSLILLVVSFILKDWIIYVFGVGFLAICLTGSAIILLFYFIAKKDLKKMNAGEESYIKARQKEEIDKINKRIEANLRKRNKNMNGKSLEEDIDDYMFYDEIFDD